MADLGLWNQGWTWVLSQKHMVTWAHMAARCGRERLAFLVDRHWPAMSRAYISSSRLVLAALRQWQGCTARGFLVLASLGPAAVFLIFWSCFLCMTSPACALYALLSLVEADPSPAASNGAAVKAEVAVESPRFSDSRWVNGTWDLALFGRKGGAVDWDSVIDWGSVVDVDWDSVIDAVIILQIALMTLLCLILRSFHGGHG